jgi:hypothetical protein
MLALLSVSLVAIFTEYAYAQVRFARTYGGTSVDGASSVQQTSDGGYIVAGWTSSFGAGNLDFLLIKTDAFGNVQWAKTYGGANYDSAYSVRQTSDGGYIVAGTTRSFSAGLTDLLLIKTDAFGNVQWAKTYGGTGWDGASSVQQTSDGGYIVAGHINHSIYQNPLLIKTDANGNIQWAKIYEIPYHEYASSVQQTSDGGYIVAVWDAGLISFKLIKTDANGNIQWAKAYDGLADSERSLSVQQTSDGGYIVAGGTWSFGAGNEDFFLIKLNSSGNLQWARTYGGFGDDLATSVRQTSDGGYIVAGWTLSFGAGATDIFLVKTDANGNRIWAKTYGGINSDGFFFVSVQQTFDGGYIVASRTYSFGAGNWDVFLIKTDANGNIGSCGIVRNLTPSFPTHSPLVFTRSYSAISASLTVTSPSLTVTSPTLTVTAPCPLSDDNELGISESCKPVSGIITPYKGGIKITKSGEFEVKVYNVSGGMVKSVKGKDEVKLELSRGVYFVEVISGGKVIREKVVIR